MSGYLGLREEGRCAAMLSGQITALFVAARHASQAHSLTLTTPVSQALRQRGEAGEVLSVGMAEQNPR